MRDLFLAVDLRPSLGLSVALVVLAGLAFCPVLPMIIAIGGDLYPERSSAVSGFLTGAAVDLFDDLVAGDGLFVGDGLGLTVADTVRVVNCLGVRVRWCVAAGRARARP